MLHSFKADTVSLYASGTSKYTIGSISSKVNCSWSMLSISGCWHFSHTTSIVPVNGYNNIQSYIIAAPIQCNLCAVMDLATILAIHKLSRYSSIYPVNSSLVIVPRYLMVFLIVQLSRFSFFEKTDKRNNHGILTFCSN